MPFDESADAWRLVGAERADGGVAVATGVAVGVGVGVGIGVTPGV